MSVLIPDDILRAARMTENEGRGDTPAELLRDTLTLAESLRERCNVPGQRTQTTSQT